MKEMNIAIWDITRIKPYEKNAKVHDADQVQKIAQSIKDFGWDQPIVIDANGVIIKGHGRREAALKLGLKEVPVWIRDDLTPEQVRASRLADNRVAISTIDTELFKAELLTLDYDLSGIFDDKELDFMAADLGELNSDMFVDDLDTEVRIQAEENETKVEETDSREVPIYKALGFRNIAGRDEKSVVAFMSLLQAKFNLPPERAFVEFAKQMVSS